MASGDPDPTSVVLWTRLTGMGLPSSVDVDWQAAKDAAFADIVAAGTITTGAEIGHSVHVTAEISGPVHYRFQAGGFTSPVGRAAPVPAADRSAAEHRCAEIRAGARRGPPRGRPRRRRSPR